MITVEGDYIIVYELDKRVKIENYDLETVAMDRFLYLSLRKPYVTFFNMQTKEVLSTTTPFVDLQLRSMPQQMYLIPL